LSDQQQPFPESSNPEEAPPTPRILVVDDHVGVQEVLRDSLEEAGFEVVVAGTGEDGLRAVTAGVFDAVVLDLILPDLTGHEVVARMREAGMTNPVLMLTGHSEDDLAAASLDSGADDFLTKPFARSELEARLKALIRRSSYRGPFSIGTLRLDPLRHRAVVGNTEIRLTKVEFLILVTLVEARGEFVSREELLRQVWQMDFDPGTNLVYTHVANLRNKLAEAAVDHLLQAERGKGYRVDLG
jgi:two-component system OmpR family response regulator